MDLPWIWGAQVLIRGVFFNILERFVSTEFAQNLFTLWRNWSFIQLLEQNAERVRAQHLDALIYVVSMLLLVAGYAYLTCRTVVGDEKNDLDEDDQFLCGLSRPLYHWVLRILAWWDEILTVLISTKNGRRWAWIGACAVIAFASRAMLAPSIEVDIFMMTEQLLFWAGKSICRMILSVAVARDDRRALERALSNAEKYGLTEDEIEDARAKLRELETQQCTVTPLEREQPTTVAVPPPPPPPPAQQVPAQQVPGSATPLLPSSLSPVSSTSSVSDPQDPGEPSSARAEGVTLTAREPSNGPDGGGRAGAERETAAAGGNEAAAALARATGAMTGAGVAPSSPLPPPSTSPSPPPQPTASSVQLHDVREQACSWSDAAEGSDIAPATVYRGTYTGTLNSATGERHGMGRFEEAREGGVVCMGTWRSGVLHGVGVLKKPARGNRGAGSGGVRVYAGTFKEGIIVNYKKTGRLLKDEEGNVWWAQGQRQPRVISKKEEDAITKKLGITEMWGSVA